MFQTTNQYMSPCQMPGKTYFYPMLTPIPQFYADRFWLDGNN